MTKGKLLKERCYINGEWYTNIGIENEVKKHLKNIDVFVEMDYDDTYIYATYNNIHCFLFLDLNCLYNDYKKYLKHIAKEIIYRISKELFDKGER